MRKNTYISNIKWKIYNEASTHSTVSTLAKGAKNQVFLKIKSFFVFFIYNLKK